MTAGDRGKRGSDARLVAALAAGASVPAAARAGGVSEATVYRRLREPAFRRRVDEARAEIVARAVARLSAASTEAVDTLRRLLHVESDFVRLGAAKGILELGVRLREHQDLAERVAALEGQLAAEQGGTKRWAG